MSATSLSPVSSRPARLAQPRALVAAALLFALGLAWLWTEAGGRQGLLWAVGALLGVTLYQSSFGFTHAWRVFVSDRRAAGIRAQMLMLAVGVLLFFPALSAGEIAGSAVEGLRAPIGVPLVLGAFVFGIGMQLGGGCASGTLYTAGGGNLRMLVTLLAFVAGATWATAHFDWWMELPAARPVLLLKTWGLAPTLIAYLALFALLAWGASALERRRHGNLGSIAATPRPASLLRGPWPLWWGALALVLLNFATLWLSGRPWGITSAFALWGAKALAATGHDPTEWGYWADRLDVFEAPLAEDVTTVMNLGIMLGAFGAAALAGKQAWNWRIPPLSLLAAVLGGLLMGYGSRLAFGCNIGAYFSGMLSASLHAWIWLPAAFAGSALGVRLRPVFGLAVEKTPPAGSC